MRKTVLCACGLVSQLLEKELCPECGERRRVEDGHVAILERVSRGEAFDVNPSRRDWLRHHGLIRTTDAPRAPRPDIDVISLVKNPYDEQVVAEAKKIRLRALKRDPRLRRFTLTERGQIVLESARRLGIGAKFWDKEVTCRT